MEVKTIRGGENMKLGKLIGGICVGALVAGLIPYSVKQDKEAGTCEVRSLL